MPEADKIVKKEEKEAKQSRQHLNRSKFGSRHQDRANAVQSYKFSPQ
jgi:hypothetical protein